ncbi:MAG TPA: MaoC family dehydratase N-terminal domain-containing protein [Streptosporangiaceae bacterium]|nr:MaoC family dehydratase N-terminal domain-containing protein [Streptosporangiaceae bacterium]
MAINPDYVGRAYPATAPYEVSRVKIAEFADAIGDPSPVYRDAAAAQAAGHPDVIAPPTFAIVVSMTGAGRAVADPGLGLDYSMVVHGEQQFSYTRPITAGDVVTAQATIDSIRSVGSLSMMTTRTEIRTTAGELVCTAVSTLVERGK